MMARPAGLVGPLPCSRSASAIYDLHLPPVATPVVQACPGLKLPNLIPAELAPRLLMTPLPSSRPSPILQRAMLFTFGPCGSL